MARKCALVKHLLKSNSQNILQLSQRYSSRACAIVNFIKTNVCTIVGMNPLDNSLSDIHNLFYAVFYAQ